jgi:O-antigen/teichoic acid export membrane protein
MILVQTGFPGYYTLMIGLIVLCNIILNGLMIPLWGMYGAAMATGLSFVIGIFLLKGFVRRTISMSI